MATNGSQRRWRSVRRYLNESRATLAAMAADFSAEWPRLEPALIALPGWLPAVPVPLEQVRLEWRAEPAPPRVTGAEPGSFLTRPLREDGERYPDYAAALAEVDPPALLENRPTYRLLEVGPADQGPSLTCGPAHYFDGLNISETLAHELAAICMATAGRGGRPHLNRTDLPLRNLIGDPSDLAARTVPLALCTLTLRHDEVSGEASFLLHWRDPERVASGGGMYQVAPVGVFQPAGGRDAAAESAGADPDLDLWRCMAREWSEELLGATEHRNLDYPAWPFLRRLEEARQKGGCRPYYLGLGMDPLTLVADILTVAVFEASVFDELFADLVTSNDEGRLLSEGGVGVPFTQETVRRYATGVPMQPAGAALLELAWQRRADLLG